MPAIYFSPVDTGLSVLIDVMQFLKGISVGLFYDGLGGDIKGLWDTGTSIVSGVGKGLYGAGSYLAFTYHYWAGNEEAAEETYFMQSNHYAAKKINDATELAAMVANHPVFRAVLKDLQEGLSGSWDGMSYETAQLILAIDGEVQNL